jgi:hypothetical protein
MAAEEVHHRTMLFDLYRSKFGDYLPLIRRQDVKGFVHHKPLWLVRPLGLDEVRKYAEAMEYETARFYRKASQSARDASVRQLLDKLAEAEDLALFAMLGQALSASIARAGIWREVLEFVRLPFPLLRVGRGRFFDHNIGPDFRVFRIQRQRSVRPGRAARKFHLPSSARDG